MTETAATNEQIHDELVLPYLNHAVRMYETAYATRTDIDAAMRFGCGYAKGPLTVLDELGLDVVRDALAARFEQTGDHLHKPADLLESLVAQRRTGRGSGRGFYTWNGGEVVDDEETPAADSAPQVRHEIAKVGVVGTGTMASGIVEVFAKAGYDVVFVGRSPEKTDGVIAAVAKSLDRAVAKGKLTEADKSEVLARLTPTTSRDDLAEVDLVVEAIAEDLAVKTDLFRDLDRICKDGAILSTTTSSLPVTELAGVTQRPESVIGMHFFNPAAVMKLVEVVTTELTSPEVDETVRALSAAVGKVAVSCGDRAGFIVNALLFPYLNDAVGLVDRGRADVESVDAAIKELAGFPMGPFALLDVVGTDVSLAIQQELYTEFKEPGFVPAAGLEAVVAAGDLGRKTGKGFHTYN